MTDPVDTPTTGSGAGPHCDGQVLVVDEVIGLAEGTPFSEAFGDVRGEIGDGLSTFTEAVERDDFPVEAYNHHEDGLDDSYQ